MKSLFNILGIAVVALSFAPVAQADRVEYMGSTQLHHGRDRDVVVRGDCHRPRNDRIRALKLSVRHAPANISKLVVRFGNGGRQELHVRERFPANSSSRWLDLRGDHRCVERIIVVGSAASFYPPTVHFYGLRRR